MEVIQDSQHGFSKGKACLTSLMAFSGEVAQKVDEGYRCHPSALLYDLLYSLPLIWSFCLKIRRDKDLMDELLGE